MKMPAFQALIAGSDLMIVGQNPDELVINVCWWKDISFILWKSSKVEQTISFKKGWIFLFGLFLTFDP